jgi:hypothetical protein
MATRQLEQARDPLADGAIANYFVQASTLQRSEILHDVVESDYICFALLGVNVRASFRHARAVHNGRATACVLCGCR